MGNCGFYCGTVHVRVSLFCFAADSILWVMITKYLKSREATMEEKKVLTFEELMEGFSRIEKQQEENAK